MRDQSRLYTAGFGVVAAFAGLVGVTYTFFTGIAFYTAIMACFLFTVFSVVLWQKTERAKYASQSLHVVFDKLSRRVGAETAFELIEIVGYFGMRDEAADATGEMINTKPDPAERYWLYIVLGMIGGKRAESILKNGIADDNELVQQGVAEARELLRKSGRHDRNKYKSSGRYRVAEYLSAGLTLSLCAIIGAAAVCHKRLTLKPLCGTKNGASTQTIQKPELADPNIIIARGKQGDIVVCIHNAKGDPLIIYITPSIPVLYLKMGI